jgi:hypothetical protein
MTIQCEAGHGDVMDRLRLMRPVAMHHPAGESDRAIDQNRCDEH